MFVIPMISKIFGFSFHYPPSTSPEYRDVHNRVKYIEGHVKGEIVITPQHTPKIFNKGVAIIPSNSVFKKLS